MIVAYIPQGMEYPEWGPGTRDVVHGALRLENGVERPHIHQVVQNVDRKAFFHSPGTSELNYSSKRAGKICLDGNQRDGENSLAQAKGSRRYWSFDPE